MCWNTVTALPVAGSMKPGWQQFNVPMLPSTQYAWVKENYGWGLGYFTITKGRESIKSEWKTPVNISADGMNVMYRENDICVQVRRKLVQGDLIEGYTFTNKGTEPVSLYDIGIYTPFNDNYPDAQQCINSRAHTHIWKGGSAAYVNAIRMGQLGNLII